MQQFKTIGQPLGELEEKGAGGVLLILATILSCMAQVQLFVQEVMFTLLFKSDYFLQE